MIEWVIAGSVGAAVSALWVRSRRIAARNAARERLRFFTWETQGDFHESVTIDFEGMRMFSVSAIIGDSIREGRAEVRRLPDGRWQFYRDPSQWAREQAADLAHSLEVMDAAISRGDVDPLLESDRAETMAELQRVLNEPSPPWVDMDHNPWVGALENAYQLYLRASKD